MPLEITVTSDNLFSETRRTGCWIGTFGWDTKSMDKVRTALDAYHAHNNANQKDENWKAVKAAVVNWRTKNSKEFENRDRISGGLVRKLAVQCGLDDCRTPPTPSVLFHGDLRVAPNKRKAPRVTLLPDRMVTVLHQDPTRSAVVIVDLYGADFEKQGLNQHWGTSKTVANNVIELLNATVAELPGSSIKFEIPVYICCKCRRTYDDDLREKGWARKADEEAIVSTFRNEIVSRKQIYIQSPTNSVVQGTTADGTMLKDCLREGLTTTVFVTGFNANMCVAASIFGPGASERYTPSFVDEGFDVVTSRYLVASVDKALSAEDGWPYMGNCNK